MKVASEPQALLAVLANPACELVGYRASLPRLASLWHSHQYAYGEWGVLPFAMADAPAPVVLQNPRLGVGAGVQITRGGCWPVALIAPHRFLA